MYRFSIEKRSRPFPALLLAFSIFLKIAVHLSHDSNDRLIDNRNTYRKSHEDTKDKDRET